MASRGNRKRKHDDVEASVDRIHATLRDANPGNGTEYMRDLSKFLRSMDDLQALLVAGVDFGMLEAGRITDDILMHLKGPSDIMHRLCCKTLLRIYKDPDSEQHKERVRGSGVIKDLVNIVKMHQRRESSSARDTETSCVVMNTIAHLIDCPQGIKIDDGIPLFHWFFAKPNFKVKTSSLHVLNHLCFNNEENAMEISTVAPKIMLSLADMLVCKDEEIRRSVLRLIFSLAVNAPALVDHMDFPTDMVIKPILNIIRNQSKNLPETVDLGLGILCTIVTRKEEYKVALAQLGVIPMLMQTVQLDDRQIKLYTIGLLHKLGKDVHNQVAMVDGGCLPKLFDLFNIEHQGMRRAIHGLLFKFVNNKVVISQFITGGWFERILELKGGSFFDYDNDASNAAKIIRMLENAHHHVHGELLYLMRESSQLKKVRIAVALAHFSKLKEHFKLIFCDNGGLDLLVDSLIGASNSDHVAVALYKLTIKAVQNFPDDPTLLVDNVKKRYDSVKHLDHRLSEACIIFTLKNFPAVLRRDGEFADEMVGEIRSYLLEHI